MDQLLTGLGVFDPSETILLLGGWAPYGFATDTKIVVSKAGDVISPYAGTDGDVSLALQRNKLGTLTLSLQNTSDANEVLTAFHQQMYRTRIGAFPVYLQDPQGFGLMTIGWIQSQPDVTIGSEIQSADWVIGLKDATLSRSVVSTSLSALNGITGISI